MSQQKRHAVLTSTFAFRLDKSSMLRRLASLKDSSPRRPALARVIVIFVLSMTLGVAGSQKISVAEATQKPLDIMNIKLYAYNLYSWSDFECYNELIQRESNWDYKATNGSHYGLAQMRNKHVKSMDPYTQLIWHKRYIDHRYNGKPCKALAHLKGKGWH